MRPDGGNERGARRRSRWIAAGLVVLAAAVVAVIVVVTRGDADPPLTTAAPSTTLVPLQDWKQQVEQGCQEWNERYAHLEGAEPGSAEEAVDHTSDVEELARGLAGVLDDAGSPEPEPEQAQQLVELTDDLAAAAGELHDAAESADGPAVDRAAARLEQLGEQLNAVAAQLEVPACGGY